MKYSHRVDDGRNQEIVDEEPRELSRAALRTQALFEAERLLRRLDEIAPGCHIPKQMCKDAAEILHCFPTRFELMHMAEDHPMLDAGMAQRLVSRADHLPGGDATDAATPTPPT